MKITSLHRASLTMKIAFHRLRAWEILAGVPKYGISGRPKRMRTVTIGEGFAIGAVDAVALDPNTAE